MHQPRPAFANFYGRIPEGLTLLTRRNLVKAGFAGIGGLTLPGLLKAREQTAQTGPGASRSKSVILIWMAGGPSQLDTFDPKPERPYEIRGPFGVIKSKLPGVSIVEHLPKLADRLDRFSILRSVDCRFSNHEPTKVFQTGNTAADARVNRKGDMYPAMGSVVAKFHGANRSGMPPYVAFMRGRTHIANGGYLGKRFDPFIAQQAAHLPVYTDLGVDTGRVEGGSLFEMPLGLSARRLEERESLLAQFDNLRRQLDGDGSLQALDAYAQQAVEMVLEDRARQAFDISQESSRSRQRYGNHLWCQQAMLARRLVEAGVAFVTIDLSYHFDSGTWDTHGDDVPPYGGIVSGLAPLLPVFDHLITTLVDDLQDRGMLEDTLVLALGEFGRTPKIGIQPGTGGRDHWPVVMSMLSAGGGFRHGQVIGATDCDGGQIRERPITPGDLAATIYYHMGVPLDAQYTDDRGRPINIVEQGYPIREMTG